MPRAVCQESLCTHAPLRESQVSTGEHQAGTALEVNEVFFNW
jgi:hypothetical protein